MNGGEPRGLFLASPCSMPSTNPVHRHRHARSPQKPVLGRKHTWHNCLSHTSRDVSPGVIGCRQRPTCPMQRWSLLLKGHLCPALHMPQAEVKGHTLHMPHQSRPHTQCHASNQSCHFSPCPSDDQEHVKQPSSNLSARNPHMPSHHDGN